MPKNQLFYHDIYEEITKILEQKHGVISENGRINSDAKKYFMYNILRENLKGNERIKEIIVSFINFYNDNDIKYNSELDGFTYAINSNVIHNVSLMLAPFYAKDYLKLIRLSKFNGLYECKKASNFESSIFKKRELEYIVLLYKEIYEVYDEEDEDYIMLSVKVLLHFWNKFISVNKVECRKSARISLINLVPFFGSIYRDIFTTEVILGFIDIMLKSKTNLECKRMSRMKISEFYDIYDEIN